MPRRYLAPRKNCGIPRDTGDPYRPGTIGGVVDAPGAVVASSGPRWVQGAVARQRLFDRLASADRVTLVSAPAGSGKTVLLRSWIATAGLAQEVAWVSVDPREHDPQWLWLSVLDAVRGTEVGSSAVRPLTAAPDLDGSAIVERLLTDLSTLQRPLRLVIDDVHDLASREAMRQLELLLLRAPSQIQFVLVARHDPALGLHRLRLDGQLTEIRAADLRFTVDEAGALFGSAGLHLSESSVVRLVERTEGWAAGLRLAALSLAGDPEPDRLAAEFSGTDRTVADYLLAEVLQHQPDEVRRLLLRTSILDRVNGPLANVLTGTTGAEGILFSLEEANAFVVPLDSRRLWFRYHRLFADLLELELRRTEPEALPDLHRSAAEWFEEHGFPVEAVRHFQAAEEWESAARLLCERWFALQLNGQVATAHDLLTGFPPSSGLDRPELAILEAADGLRHGSLDEVERQVSHAGDLLQGLPPERRRSLQVQLAVVRMALAYQRTDAVMVAKEAEGLVDELAVGPQPRTGDEIRVLALIRLGGARLALGQREESERRLDQAIALARRTKQAYLEVEGLATSAILASSRSFAQSEERLVQAIDLARGQGWDDEPAVGSAYYSLVNLTLCQGRLEEAARWLQKAQRTARPDLAPYWGGVMLSLLQAALEQIRGRHREALEACRSAERYLPLLGPGAVTLDARAFLAENLVRSAETDRAERIIAELGDEERGDGRIRMATAALRLAMGEPGEASAALAPVVSGTAKLWHPRLLPQAFLMEAIARDVVGDAASAERALGRALELAEPNRLVLPFLLFPAPQMLKRYRQQRGGDASLLNEILDLLAEPASSPPSRPPGSLLEPLTAAETRVLHYLPTHLSAQEIGRELYLSVHTVRTHMRHIYDKLGTHNRTGSVAVARDLGLLAPAMDHR